ncbi:hypothetical protein M2110_004866 [Paenibacillus sp. PastF-4]|nr:hypothetical protein [Paenibacillus sp. PastF-4]
MSATSGAEPTNRMGKYDQWRVINSSNGDSNDRRLTH